MKTLVTIINQDKNVFDIVELLPPKTNSTNERTQLTGIDQFNMVRLIGKFETKERANEIQKAITETILADKVTKIKNGSENNQRQYTQIKFFEVPKE